MDRKTLEQDLKRAEEHVRLGESHLRSQKRVIADLKTDRHDTRMAHKLYRTFAALQETHVANRDRLMQELNQAETEDSVINEIVRGRSAR